MDEQLFPNEERGTFSTVMHLILYVRVYRIIIHTVKGGGELTREKFREAIVHKAGRNINMTDCISTRL